MPRLKVAVQLCNIAEFMAITHSFVRNRQLKKCDVQSYYFMVTVEVWLRRNLGRVHSHNLRGKLLSLDRRNRWTTAIFKKTVNRAFVVRVVGEAAISTPSCVVVSLWCVNNGQRIFSKVSLFRSCSYL
jgi:hypothetical protein